jgi:hypothetical protein
MTPAAMPLISSGLPRISPYQRLWDEGGRSAEPSITLMTVVAGAILDSCALQGKANRELFEKC